MRYCIYSDVHANLEALLALLADVQDEADLHFIFLGDAVGYGPNPNECIDLIRAHAEVFLIGNHDQAAISAVNIENFNPYARKAILWTREVLTVENKEFLASLPFKYVDDDMTLVHATPYQPKEWHYIFTLSDALLNFGFFTSPLCFIGHSHNPVSIVRRQESDVLVVNSDEVFIEAGEKYLINVGSLGQPRDGISTSCYVVLDLDARVIQFRRVWYDIKATQKKMLAVSMPEYLIRRLQFGR